MNKLAAEYELIKLSPKSEKYQQKMFILKDKIWCFGQKGWG